VLVAAGLALAALLGCASSAPPEKEKGKEQERVVLAGSAARELLVLPFNVAVVMPPELDAGSSIAWDELVTYLGAEGRHLKTVDPRAARRLWLESIRAVRAGQGGAEAGYDEASRVFVGKLAGYAAFDTVVVPSLFVREAAIEGTSARWDGVERPLRFESRGAAPDLAEQVNLEGLAPAASLHALVLDASGRRIQEATAGIELLVDVRVTPSRSAGEPAFALVPRRELFADRAHLRQAIARALSPFLPPPLPGSP
jgi:hypothetical protein